MMPLALLLAAGVVPTHKTRFPSDPTSIVLIVLIAVGLILAIRGAIKYFRNGGDQ